MRIVITHRELGVYLGNGWYRGVVGYEGIRNHYGDRLALILQLEITYTDGHMLVISSDGNWKASAGPILMSEIYDGETYDARREQIGWTSPEFDDHEWPPVETISAATDALIAPEGPPVPSFFRHRQRHRPLRSCRSRTRQAPISGRVPPPSSPGRARDG